MTPYLVFFFLPVSALLFWIHNTKAGITPNLITHHLTVMVNMTAKIKLIPSSPSPPFSKPVFSPLLSLYCVWTHDTVTKTNNLWVTERDAKVRFSVCFSLVQWIYLCSMSSTLSSNFFWSAMYSFSTHKRFWRIPCLFLCVTVQQLSHFVCSKSHSDFSVCIFCVYVWLQYCNKLKCVLAPKLHMVIYCINVYIHLCMPIQ